MMNTLFARLILFPSLNSALLHAHLLKPPRSIGFFSFKQDGIRGEFEDKLLREKIILLPHWLRAKG